MLLHCITVIVNFGFTAPVQSPIETANQIVANNENDEHEIRENFQNLFDSIAKNDVRKSETHREILKEEIAKKQIAFDAMKDELWIARNRRAYKKRNFYGRSRSSGNIIETKREINAKDRDVTAIVESEVQNSTKAKKTNATKRRSSGSQKAAKGNRTSLTNNLPVRFSSDDDPKKTYDKLRQIYHDRDYRLPAVRPHEHANSSQKLCDNFRCRLEREHLYSLLGNVMRSKGSAASQMTFEEALEKAEPWLLRLMRSRLTVMKDKLDQAKDRFTAKVFTETNDSFHDLAGEIYRIYNRVNQRLKEAGIGPPSPDEESYENQAAEDLLRQYTKTTVTTTTTEKTTTDPRARTTPGPNKIRLSA